MSWAVGHLGSAGLQADRQGSSPGGLDRAPPAAPASFGENHAPPKRKPSFGSCVGFGDVGDGKLRISFWIPSFYVRSFGMPLATVSYAYAAMLLLGGVSGTWIGAWLGDRWGPTRPTAYLLIPMGALLASLPFFIMAVSVRSAPLSLLLMTVPTALGGMGFGQFSPLFSISFAWYQEHRIGDISADQQPHRLGRWLGSVGRDIRRFAARVRRAVAPLCAARG